MICFAGGLWFGVSGFLGFRFVVVVQILVVVCFGWLCVLGGCVASGFGVWRCGWFLVVWWW